MKLIANARMYAVNGEVTAAWSALFEHIANRSGIALEIVAHAAPAPLEDLWRRDDLALAFMCGYPFASNAYPVQAIAAPIPMSGNGRALYATRLAVRADSAILALPNSFGRRIGWTVAHSQSGFNALRTHLLTYHANGKALYSASIGPLLTPRRVIEAILSGAIDIGPLDSYFHDLLLAHEPETARQLRIVDTTSPRPIPLLVASRMADGDMVMAMRRALVCIGDDAVGRGILAKLRLTGFANIIPNAYSILTREAEKAEKAGYFQPG